MSAAPDSHHIPASTQHHQTLIPAMNPNEPNRLFALPPELFEEVTSYLDYLSLKSLSSTNHVAQRSLIPKPYLVAAMMVMELYDNDETEILKSKDLLPCYQCLQVFPAGSGFGETCDTNPDQAGFRGGFACARMCRSCNDKAGGCLSRAPKWKRLRKVRIGVLKRRGWAPAGREDMYKARREREEARREREEARREREKAEREREEAVKLQRAREMEGKAWFYDGQSEKWKVIDSPFAGVGAGRTAG